MAFVVKNDLQSFADKLKNYKAQGDLADKVLDNVLKKGEEIAREQYAISNKGTVINSKGKEVQSSITISSSKSGNTGKIISTGSQVAYLEFGTGVNGEGTYDGKLPTEPITFDDNSGKTWTTQGWEYHYRYNQTQPESVEHNHQNSRKSWTEGHIYHQHHVCSDLCSRFPQPCCVRSSPESLFLFPHLYDRHCLHTSEQAIR